MLTVGIETSCDETAVAVTEARRVLSSVVSSSVRLHATYGGVVPEIASRYHVEYIIDVLERALRDAGVKLSAIELIAATNGPGLVGALMTGLSLAKALSAACSLPLIGVNHVLAHLYSAFVGATTPPRFPFVGLVVSGGHTALFSCSAIDRQRVLGQTQDDAVGEAYDKVAKLLGLGYPGGPAIEKAARQTQRERPLVFPKSRLGKGSLDFSFSGIKTAVLYHVRKLPRLDASVVSDISDGFQEAALDILVEKTLAACAAVASDRVVVGGGVAANGRLREKLTSAAEAKGIAVFFPERRYCMDNGAMIGVLGEALYRTGMRADLFLGAEPNLEVTYAE